MRELISEVVNVVLWLGVGWGSIGVVLGVSEWFQRRSS